MKFTAFITISIMLLSLFSSYARGETESKPIFKYGIMGPPETIDPALARNSTSIAILDQVMEGLVAYNLTDPELSVIPHLATDIGTWNAEATEVTFHLREGVTFHDGTPFNASVVKYSFDRLIHLIEEEISPLGQIYKPLVQIYPDTPLVINNTVVIDEFTIKFVLNYPFVPLNSLFCFSGSYIGHPSMPWNRTIEISEILYGTGPYMLNSCSVDEIVFEAYPAYWRPQPEIQKMIWSIYTDSLIWHEHLRVGAIHLINEIDLGYKEQLEENSAIAISRPQGEATIECIGMNNNFINKTFRQAISFAFDYAVFIDEIKLETVKPLTSIVPFGILFHDPTVEPTTHNRIKARQLLVDTGLAGDLLPNSPNTSWMNLANTAPIARFNYTYPKKSSGCDCAFHDLLATDLSLIGVKLDIYELLWPDYFSRLTGDHDKLQLFKITWTPDYNDPSTYLNPLFSNRSAFNTAQVNDPWLEETIQIALTLTNESTRREKYSEIQHYIVEDLMPFIFLDSPTYVSAYSRDLGNFRGNPLLKLDFYAYTWCSSNSETSSTTNTSSTSSSTDNRSISGYPFLIIFGLIICSIGMRVYHKLKMKKEISEKVKN